MDFRKSRSPIPRALQKANTGESPISANSGESLSLCQVMGGTSNALPAIRTHLASQEPKANTGESPISANSGESLSLCQVMGGTSNALPAIRTHLASQEPKGYQWTLGSPGHQYREHYKRPTLKRVLSQPTVERVLVSVKTRRSSETLAYYTTREKLRELVKDNNNTKFIVTGHSLGGALAILFAAILALHKEDLLLERLEGVYTFWQPRVRDKEFKRFMEEQMNSYCIKYQRMVYSNDLVPRIPFDSSTFYSSTSVPAFTATTSIKKRYLKKSQTRITLIQRRQYPSA
ncbi:hypothetical protein M0R45_004477 [Rubus argutus]|uniref:Fungal lipase-type domain-containing protein n=1 Tax=Rubus argutus TaxID=59490 RepID=A0AAW1YJZ9_RUBAR